jgi:DNA-binding response OmpR family regulator
MNPTRHNYSVLYVEDEEKILLSYKRVLERLFDRVFCASDGHTGHNLYQLYAPDIVIADIVLPKMDGLELLKKIRRQDMRTRAILLTAHSGREMLLQATELDITNYLIKPVRKEQFLKAMEKAVSQLRFFDANPVEQAMKRTERLLFEYLGVEDPTRFFTKNEIRFLSILLDPPDHYHAIEEIEERFYLRFNKEISTNAIKATIKRLRKKLGAEAIENRFGHGYRLHPKKCLFPTLEKQK